MMWASLLLGGILSGWWGALALAAAPPANLALTRTNDRTSVDSDRGISDRGGISGVIMPNEHSPTTAKMTKTTTMMMMTRSSRSIVRRDLRDIGLTTNLPPTSEATIPNWDLLMVESNDQRESWNNQLPEDPQNSGQIHWERTIEPFGIKMTKGTNVDDTKTNRDEVTTKNQESVNGRDAISLGPLLENFFVHPLTPMSVQKDNYAKNDDAEKRNILTSTAEFDESKVNDNDDSFDDISELQDYPMYDEGWSRESRISEFDNTGSIYPELDIETRLPRHTSSSSGTTTVLWAEAFGPVLEGPFDRVRVSRSAKQQRAKNRTRSESAREQRRKCRNKGCRGRNWCPDMDIGNRAFLAPTVFEGKARSMSSLRKPGSNYAVTFEVKQVYKSQPGFQPLLKNDSVRLHFRDKAAPGKSTLCNNAANGNFEQSKQQQQQRDNPSGVVRANIKRGKVYLVFVNRVGPRNFTILGEPVIRSKKNEQAVQAVIRPDYVREITLSELRDSVARLRDRVKLVCRTRGSPPPQVHWLKDGVPLHPRRGLRIQHKRRRSKVVISSARQEDSGRYECIAESTSGHRASLAAQLLVAHDTRIQDTTTASWPRQEQPCPIAGDFCMNGGTCLFFETVGEPACRCAEGFTGLRCETKDVISTGSVYNRHRAPFSCKLGLSTSYYC